MKRFLWISLAFSAIALFSNEAKAQPVDKNQILNKRQTNIKISERRQKTDKQQNAKQKQKNVKQANAKWCLRPGDYNTGPILSQAYAQLFCPGVCARQRCAWSGHWKTVIHNKVSACGCRK